MSTTKGVDTITEVTFQAMLDASPNALILINSLGNIMYMNAYVEKLFAYKRDEIIGKSIEILLPRKFSNNHTNYIQSFLKKTSKSSNDIEHELCALRKDNTEFPVEVQFNPIETTLGKMILTSIIDITKRKKAEENHKNYIKRLENKNKELEQFTYVASHDLQEPLKSITGLTEILTTEYNNLFNNEVTKIFSFLNESTERMKELIAELLDYNRLGQKSILEKVDCNQLINEVIQECLSSSLYKEKIHFKIESLPNILGHKNELKQLFKHLINNSLKFKKNKTEPIIRISARKKNLTWVFSVEDNGIGMDMKFTQKIFTIFQQLHSKEKFPGSGIGLSHCKKIVELHDGDIWLKSIPDQGTTIYFTINTKSIS
ncbi:sensor histidine kinase [Aquimarina pacifica]|uniref:sensor histidine kinase n=1 Tax=Aquimarina pacifica TaxID=1296415 RepID=UPI000472EA5F|nr:ATP-binding protein [Aquimarina pacifica]